VIGFEEAYEDTADAVTRRMGDGAENEPYSTSELGRARVFQHHARGRPTWAVLGVPLDIAGTVTVTDGSCLFAERRFTLI
jgi:hypothetical protein